MSDSSCSTADPSTSSGDGAALSRSEDLTISVDGKAVATALPRVETVVLETDQGRVVGPGFVAADDTYVLPTTGTDLTGITETVASGRMNANN